MNWQQKLREWQSCEHLDSGMKDQLKTLSDPAELEERFYKYLSFGTGGMRGELGSESIASMIIQLNESLLV